MIVRPGVARTLLMMVLCLAPKASLAQTSVSSAAACQGLTKLQLPGVALTVTKSAWIPAGSAPPAGPGAPVSPVKLPAHCRLDGIIDRRTGAAGADYGDRKS